MKTNWSKIVNVILNELLYSREELATICQVQGQTIPNWQTGKNKPGVFARRKMIEILNTEGYNKLPDGNCPHGVNPPVKTIPLSDLDTLQEILKGLNKQRQMAVFEFAKFLQSTTQKIGS